MIPILYESTETAFASNGLGRLRDCISCVVTEERNGVYECDFEYPVTGTGYEKIKLGRIIAVEHDDSDDVQPFDIVSCSRPINGVVTFHAQHISYRQSGITVSGTNINSLADAFTALGTTTPTNPFSYYTDKTSTGYCSSFDGVPRSVRSILGGIEGSILDAYGGEYEWNRWTVNLWSERGKTRNFTIRYGVNLLDYTEEIDYSGSYTSVIPFWKGSGTNGEVIVKGSQVSSGSSSYGNRDICMPLDLSEKFEGQPTAVQLQNMAATMLSSNEPYMPAQNITVDFVRLQDADEYSQFEDLLECKLCDTVKVVFPMYNMSGSFKIVKTEYNVLLEKYNSMELGTLSTSLAEALGISDGSSKTSSTGTVCYASSSKTISSTDIDSPTTGASISLPAGTYVVTGQWAFYTRSTTGTTNSECQIYNSTNSTYIARERVFAGGANWNVLNCTGIVTLTETSTLVVRGATSRPYTTATDNYIRAVQIS